MSKLKHKIYRIIYRMVREDMVVRMRLNGFTWTKINSVLRVLRQDQIVKVEKYENGVRLTYQKVQGRKRILFTDKSDNSTTPKT